MAEDIQLEAQQLKNRLVQLVEQWSEGKTSVKNIVGLNDEELYAIAAQGYIFFLEGKTEQARVIFEGLVAVDPRNPYYYRALGAIYWRLKDASRAIKQFTYAIRVWPNDVAAYVNRAEVHVFNRDFASAKEDLLFAVQHSSREERALQKKAKAMLQMIGQ